MRGVGGGGWGELTKPSDPIEPSDPFGRQARGPSGQGPCSWPPSPDSGGIWWRLSPSSLQALAKVVEGWNRHEAERTAALRRLQVEKEAAEQALGRQKEVRLGQGSRRRARVARWLPAVCSSAGSLLWPTRPGCSLEPVPLLLQENLRLFFFPESGRDRRAPPAGPGRPQPGAASSQPVLPGEGGPGTWVRALARHRPSELPLEIQRL